MNSNCFKLYRAYSISFNSDKCWPVSLELNSKALYQSSRKKKESCCFVFPSSTKREIRHFHVVVVQRRQRNVQKSVMYVQSCYFANLNLLVYSGRSRCRCRRRRLCLSSLLIKVDTTVYFAATYPRYVSGGKKSCIMARTSGTSFSIRNRHAFGPASKV